MILIGFCGLPGAGKSTAAMHLASKHGFVWSNIGDPMKAMMRAFFELQGLDEEEIRRRLWGDLKQEPDPLLDGKTPTFALQTLGKEWRDLFSPTFWVDRWVDRISKLPRVVCDGMRYPDEMPVFRRLGGKLIRIVRPGVVERTGHPAERQALPFDYSIMNDGTVDDLVRAVEGVVFGNSQPVYPRGEDHGRLAP